MQKSLMHNKQIRVTAGKYQGKRVQLWRAIGVADYCGTLAGMEGGFGYVTKSFTRRLLFFHMQPNGM